MKPEKSQLDRFTEAAKELGCDEDEERFDATVKKLARSVDKEKADTKSE